MVEPSNLAKDIHESTRAPVIPLGDDPHYVEWHDLSAKQQAKYLRVAHRLLKLYRVEPK